MTEKQEALFRTFKPLIVGLGLASAIFVLLQFFTPMQLVFGVATIVAIYMLILVYEMNLDSVRRERSESAEN